jgi:hypothetical protein
VNQFLEINFFIEKKLYRRKFDRKLELYSAVTFFHSNSREFTKFHTFSQNLFFLLVCKANNAKIASNWLFHKKSFIFPIRESNVDCFEYERFFVKKPMRGYF